MWTSELTCHVLNVNLNVLKQLYLKELSYDGHFKKSIFIKQVKKMSIY